jgi:hypothetical protein
LSITLFYNKFILVSHIILFVKIQNDPTKL